MATADSMSNNPLATVSLTAQAGSPIHVDSSDLHLCLDTPTTHTCLSNTVANSGAAGRPLLPALLHMQCLRSPGGLLGAPSNHVRGIVLPAVTPALLAAAWPRTVTNAAKQDQPRMPKPPKPQKAPTNLADNEGSPFEELGLKEIMDGKGRVRVRQHVNPLASKFQQPTPAVDWAQVYKDPTRPLFVDMGCGPGRFLLLLCRHHMRQQQPPMNYLGLEIRQPLVERANKWCEELGMQGQVHFLFTNVSVSLAGLLENYPGPVAAMSAQFPDPHFKKRHKKRRMVQPSVVQVARERLMPGGQVFLQSDVLDAVAAMRDEYEQHASDVLQLSPLHSTAPVFHWTRQQEYAELAAAAAAAAEAKAAAQQQQQQQQQEQEQEQDQDSLHEQQHEDAHIPSEAAAAAAAADAETGDHSSTSSPAGSAEASSSEDTDSGDDFVSKWAEGGWLVDNPLGVPTERENYVQNQGGKVFRVLLVKKE